MSQEVLMARFLFAAVGLLFVAISVPLIRRKIPPNAWYGLRVPATLASEKVWYEANAISGRELAWFGAAFTVLAFILPVFVQLSEKAYALTCAAVLVVGTLVLAARGARVASRLRQAEGGAA
jgi:uncharacterized membrane protein